MSEQLCYLPPQLLHAIILDLIKRQLWMRLLKGGKRVACLAIDPCLYLLERSAVTLLNTSHTYRLRSCHDDHRIAKMIEAGLP